jgi:hypothetical protein
LRGSSRTSPRRPAIYALGAALFVCGFLLTVAITLPGETVLGLIAPSLESRGVRLTAQSARLVFPVGIRLEGATVAAGRGRPIDLDEVTATWEWTGLFRWLPSHLRVVRGGSVADIRLSPAFWKPSRGVATLSGVSSEDFPFPVFGGSGAGFSVRRAEARWRGRGKGLSASGSGELDYLKIPIPAQESPIREARIDNAALSFVVRGDMLRFPRLQGSYEGSRVEGTGEIARFLTPGAAAVTFHLSIRNPFEGRVGTLFDMLAKNAKNANLRIVGALTAPKAEIELF